jgi:lipopolysaccharide export system permease protein
MRILHRYLAHRVHKSILLIMTALVGLFAFLDFIWEIDELKGNYYLWKVFAYVILNLPGHVYELFPMGILIGALLTLSQLANHSEFTVMRVSGLSLQRIGMSLLSIGLPFVAITFIVGEFVSPPSERLAQQIRLQATSSVVAREFRSGLWVKDENSFVNVQEVQADSSLRGVRVYEFDENHRLRLATYAKNGVYQEGRRWLLQGIVQTRFEPEKTVTARIKEAHWISVLTPDLLNVLLIKPTDMSVQNLYAYVKYLRENDQKTARYETALWYKIAYPFAVLVMLLLAAPFCLLPLLSGGTNIKIFAGVVTGLVFQVLNRLFSNLGQLNDWPPVLSATVPTLLFLLTAVLLTRWIERH